MLDFLFTLGQAGSALLVLYGGFLVIGQWLPRLKRSGLNPALEDELMLLKHLHNDA